MTQSEVTVKQFARWTFLRDLKEKLYPLTMTWEKLDEEDRELYPEEADYYINEHPKDDWPIDILERLK